MRDVVGPIDRALLGVCGNGELINFTLPPEVRISATALRLLSLLTSYGLHRARVTHGALPAVPMKRET